MKFSKNVMSCSPSPIRKFAPYADAAWARGIRILPLNIGQPDIETPPEFFEAVRSFEPSVLAYAPSDGVPVYLDAVRGYYAGIGCPLAPGEVLATSGGSEALQIALQCILDEGSEVLTPEPFYPNYNTFVALCGGRIVPIPTTPEEGYQYADRAKIEALITDKTRAIMITNPGNPTGVVLTEPQLRMLVELAHERGLFLIADEVYREFTYNGAPLMSALSYDFAAENVIVTDSISKRFSACGARIGALISHNHEFMAQALKICQGRLCTATLDQVGAAALYSVSPEYFSAVREEYRARRDAALAKLAEIPGAVCRQPEGAFYLMVKLPIDDAEKFQRWLLEEFDDNGDTVMFTPGEGLYATPGKGTNEVRMAYVIKKELLERALDVLAEAIARYKAR